MTFGEKVKAEGLNSVLIRMNWLKKVGMGAAKKRLFAEFYLAIEKSR